MAYTAVWDETLPSGAEAANTIATIFRADKVNIRERLAGIFGLSSVQWAADPIVPLTLTLTNALSAGSITLTTAISQLVPGATSFAIRNNANSANNLILTDAGVATFRAGITLTAGALTLSAAGGVSTIVNAGTVLKLDNSLAAADFRALIDGRRGGTTRWFLGTNVNDFFVLLDSTGAIANLLITDAGVATFRSSLAIVGALTGATTGVFSGIVTTSGLTLSAAVGKIIPGATSISHRNAADSADNLLITDAGAITVRNTISGITTLTATSLAGTLTTTAQGNITSVGTLTGLTVSGSIASGGSSITAGLITNSIGVGILIGGTSVVANRVEGVIPSNVTSAIAAFATSISTANVAFTISSAYNFQANNISLGAGSAITDQYGFYVGALSSGTRNWPIWCTSISAGAGGITFRDTALATGATGGHLFIPTSAGTPTGVPAINPTGQVAFQYDSTNNKLYVYNGAWKATIALT